ncbi:carbohydrate ABC transporter permease [Microbacterium allomyrinae]|uniref:Sugar ABC transporter permease n=1 Tax=Microbacterium allomyrinae TaxID=2830666 RepID=A0A9X1S592_9MICO|nr:sugar ABC transporter permease [Microbacterium allomyrinae]MCC2033988.1 sugar ABC transporter permease [Microbacterium allomyrinae]
MATAAPTTLQRDARPDESVGSRRRPPIAHLLLIPAIVILLFGMGYPVIWQVITSFQKYGALQQLGGKAPEFVGLDNYIAIATSPTFWAVALRSIVFCLVTAFITVVIGMALALLMTRVAATVRIILQLSLLLAWAMPVVAAMTVWIWLFDRRRGVVNYLLDLIPGVEMNQFNWIGGEPFVFFLVASIIVVWMSVPFVAFSSYAGLTQVSGEIIEASQLDGATGWQRLRFIVLPVIRPVIMIVLLLNLIWDLRVFTQITMLQDAGSNSSDYDLLGTYIYKMGVAGLNYGQGAAMALFVLALTIVLSWFYIRSLLKEDQV